MFDSTHIRAEADQGVLVVQLKCEKLSEYETTVVQNEVQQLAPGLGWKLAFDASQVQIISSVGLGMLISLNRMARTNKGRLAVFGLSEQLRGLFKISMLDKALSLQGDRASAVRACL
ncbi:MAG: STAS domain-containing protein [Phycisphaerales bacterium]